MLYEYDKRTRDLFVEFLFLCFKISLLSFEGVFNKIIIPLAFVGHEMIIANSAIPSHIQRALVVLSTALRIPTAHDFRVISARI